MSNEEKDEDLFKEQYFANVEQPVFKSIERNLLIHLLKYRSIINTKKHLPKNFGSRRTDYLDRIGLCCNDQTSMSILEQEFEKHKLGYYNDLGHKIPDELLTIKNKYRFYRFENYKKRLEFVEKLIKELEKKINL